MRKRDNRRSDDRRERNGRSVGETLVRDEQRYEVLRERERERGYESRRRWKGGEQEIWNKIIKNSREEEEAELFPREIALGRWVEEGCEQYLTM